MTEYLNQLKLFEQQLQDTVLPKWVKARMNGLVKQYPAYHKHLQKIDNEIDYTQARIEELEDSLSLTDMTLVSDYRSRLAMLRRLKR